MRRLGSEPVILDTVQTAASSRNIKLYMNSRGFYESTSRYEIAYKRNRKAVVTYSVRQGEPYRIHSLAYDYQDTFLEQVLRQDTASTLIRRGDIFDLTVLNEERQRIASYLKDRGYYRFSVNNISYIADTLAGDHLVDITMIIRQQLEGYTPDGEPIYDNNAVYRLGNIFVYPNYDATAAATDPDYLRSMDTTYYRGLYIVRSGKARIKPQTLRRAIPIYSDYLYSADDKQRTSSNLQRLNYFKNASVTFSEPESDNERYITYIGTTEDGANARKTARLRHLLHPRHAPGLHARFRGHHLLGILRVAPHHQLPQPQPVPRGRTAQHKPFGRLRIQYGRNGGQELLRGGSDGVGHLPALPRPLSHRPGGQALPPPHPRGGVDQPATQVEIPPYHHRCQHRLLVEQRPQHHLHGAPHRLQPGGREFHRHRLSLLHPE